MSAHVSRLSFVGPRLVVQSRVILALVEIDVTSATLRYPSVPKHNSKKIVGQFVPHRADLIGSYAWRAASRAARGILDRLELEHMAHGGQENGKLICTYDDFAEFGIRRPSISIALSELCDLGLIEIVERGRGGNAAYRRPSKYRLTYLPANSAKPTDEWRQVSGDHHPRYIK